VQALIAEGAVRAISNATGLTFKQVMHTVVNSSANLVSMLDSPQGWSILSSFSAMSCGVDREPMTPTIH